MNPQIEQTLHDVQGMSFEEKVGTGKEAITRLARGLRNGGITDEQISKVLTLFTRLFVSGDKNCTREEYELFKAITGSDLSYDEFYNVTNGGSNPQFVEDIFELIQILEHDDRIALVIYGAILVSADKEITYPEAQLIDRILTC